jgi:hypothetical protein
VHLTRIGAPGAQKPVVRLDDEHHVDVSDLAGAVDEASSGGGLDRIGPVGMAVLDRTGDGAPEGALVVPCDVTTRWGATTRSRRSSTGSSAAASWWTTPVSGRRRHHRHRAGDPRERLFSSGPPRP